MSDGQVANAMKHCIASWGQLCARRLEVKGVQEGNVFQGICIWVIDIKRFGTVAVQLRLFFSIYLNSAL